MKNETDKIVVYQALNGAVEVRLNKEQETVMLTQKQVGLLFNVQKAAISKHVRNIFASKELDKFSTVSILETVQFEGNRKIIRKIEYYNLDLVLSIGYRVNSLNATKFRQWATKTLRKHIINGYTINKKRLAQNYDSFMKAVESVKKFLPSGDRIKTADALELVRVFADTWFSLDLYDKTGFPVRGVTKKHILITARDLGEALSELKKELLLKQDASDLFGLERSKESVAGIVGNIFQTFDGNDLYSTVEEKAAHLLYFIVKNHPFIDGNKRSGAFAFVWFLQQTKLLNTAKLTPSALTALTLLVAESKPTDKDRMIGLILMLLKK